MNMVFLLCCTMVEHGSVENTHTQSHVYLRCLANGCRNPDQRPLAYKGKNHPLQGGFSFAGLPAARVVSRCLLALGGMGSLSCFHFEHPFLAI
jgi:hypothetical protein